MNSDHPLAGEMLTGRGDDRGRASVGKARHCAAYLRRRQG
jgi:hypothetical protein